MKHKDEQVTAIFILGKYDMFSWANPIRNVLVNY